MLLGNLTLPEIDQLLRSERLARIACQHDGRPYLVPMGYAYDGEALYFHSLPGAKIDIMRRHPQVCIEVDHIDHMASWRSVVVWGEFEELHGAAAAAALTRLILRLLPPGAGTGGRDPFAPPELADQAVLFRVRITERHGRFARP